MDYLYENLGDERFQEFCSCLVSKEFPNMQAFPVGQPDGGRDTLVYSMNSTEKEFIVFQVKFVRNPNQERDVHKWLTETIEKEVSKVNELIPKGAKKYYLLTNVRGTAHLDSGSKDKVNKIFEDNIKIPSICWWRDDLSILFEKDPLFKWSFPQILNGQDILNSLLFGNLQESKERRDDVIRAYLSDQFENDDEVKFKQINLQNRLLDLFTDVPMRIKKYNEKNLSLKQTLDSFEFRQRRTINELNFLFQNEKESIGAAEFLLHPKVQSNIERILLEGGPGQGKSTISQYICQVHRARLLNKVSDIDLLPANIKHTPVRLPFKIDLRDVAAWIEKKNPYQGSLSQESFDSNWKKSLETFLVTHISYHSKLEEFTTTDFIALCKPSPILFVFDGFDEIANIKVRSEVIDFINKGITRISVNVKSVQVIITSRPAAFSDAVEFSIDKYPHFELTDLTSQKINEYVEKWIQANKLVTKAAYDLRALIKDKLELPQLKDLVKSPMQLAIFISLLNTKGKSLPNKRTALYDSYIELFFDRESEKSSLILNKRVLIIEIHQYLAWVLHSEAELYKNSGSIYFNDLIIRLKDYLSKEGHDTSIADQLFDVMKERVCALVSRVQGTFEFEVQPLREYFCAKYLYTSAPHSSAGSIKSGTKPDRLHAILRNFYWQNVVRFFAGCADAGELDMIIQELQELHEDTDFKYTNYPQIITSQILSDYVFSQKPLKLKTVLRSIVDGINNGNIINQDRRFSSNEPIHLPNECGQEDVSKACFQQLCKFTNNDYTNELIGIINNNPFNKLEIWSEYASKFKGVQLTEWLGYAFRLNLIQEINEEQLLDILKEGDTFQTKKRLHFILAGGRLDLINKNKNLKVITFNGILNHELVTSSQNDQMDSLSFLSYILHPYIALTILKRDLPNIIFINYFSQFSIVGFDSLKAFPEVIVADDIDKSISDFSKSISKIYNTPLSDFKVSIEPWNEIVENARTSLNDHWRLNIIATIAAGIKSKEETFEEFSSLNDTSLSLCKRVRCARMKSGNNLYWEKQLDNSSNFPFTLLVLFTWATPATLIHLLPILSKITKSLNSDEFSRLIKGLSLTAEISVFDKAQQKNIEEEMLGKKYHNEIKYLLSLRFNNESRPKFIYDNIDKHSRNIDKIVEIKIQYLIGTFLEDPSNMTILKEIKKLYKNSYQPEDRHYIGYRKAQDPIKIPYDVAKIIMKDCNSYPSVINSLAEISCRHHVNENLRPVGEIAKNEKWFE